MCFPVLQKTFMHPVVNSRLVFLPDACSGELYPTFLQTLHKFPFKQNTCQGPWAGITRARAEDAEKTTLTAPSYSPAPTSSMSRAKRAPHQVASQSWRDSPPQVVPLHPLPVIPREKQRKLHPSLERDQEGENKSCYSQRENDGRGDDWLRCRRKRTNTYLFQPNFKPPLLCCHSKFLCVWHKTHNVKFTNIIIFKGTIQ